MTNNFNFDFSNFNEKFLAQTVLDLVDGISNEQELVEKLGYSEEAAAKLWDLVQHLRAGNSN